MIVIFIFYKNIELIFKIIKSNINIHTSIFILQDKKEKKIKFLPYDIKMRIKINDRNKIIIFVPPSLFLFIRLSHVALGKWTLLISIISSSFSPLL